MLMKARRDAACIDDRVGLARVEIAMAAAAVVRDDDAGAEACLREARRVLPTPPPSVAARAWVVDARRARVSGSGTSALPPAPAEPKTLSDDPIDADEHADLAVELALERAIHARTAKDLTVAHDALCLAQALVEHSRSVRLVALVEALESCGLRGCSGRPGAGADPLPGGKRPPSRCGPATRRGPHDDRFAEMLVAQAAATPAAPPPRGSAAPSKSSAARPRGAIGSRSAAGSRAFGRRVFDRVMTEGTDTRIEAFERARGSLVNSLSNVGHATDRALTDIEVDVAARGEVHTARRARRRRPGRCSRAGADAQWRRERPRRVDARSGRDGRRGAVRARPLADAPRRAGRDRQGRRRGVAARRRRLPRVAAARRRPRRRRDRSRGCTHVDRRGGRGRRRAPRTSGSERSTASSAGATRAVDAQRFAPRGGERLRAAHLHSHPRARGHGVLYGDKLRRNGKFRRAGSRPSPTCSRSTSRSRSTASGRASRNALRSTSSP